jgi:hypothetical protein
MRVSAGSSAHGCCTSRRVRVLLDHVGRIDGEYRTFSSIDVHRVWRPQRLDGGPWKIVDVQGL